MAALFDHILLDPGLLRKEATDKYPVSANLEWANSQPRNALTGVRKTTVGRLDAIEIITVDLALLNDNDRQYFISHLRGGQGSSYGMRIYLPYDHTATLEPVGVGNGSTTTFKLVKSYYRLGDSTHPDVRRIFMPVVQQSRETNGFQLIQPRSATAPRVVGAGAPNYFDAQMRVYLNNVDQTGNTWTCDCKTGIITFTSPPGVGVIVAWSGVFDIPVAFDGNQFTQIYDLSSGAQYTLREMLGPELGLT
jgi:hypothetical protein